MLPLSARYLAERVDGAWDVRTISDTPYQVAVVGRPYGAEPIRPVQPARFPHGGLALLGAPAAARSRRTGIAIPLLILQVPFTLPLIPQGRRNRLLVSQGWRNPPAHPAGPLQSRRSFRRAIAIPLLIPQGRRTELRAATPHAGPSAQNAGGCHAERENPAHPAGPLHGSAQDAGR